MSTSRDAGQGGSGSVIVIALIAAIVLCGALLLPVCAVLVARAGVSSAADASALAGADVAIGIAPGSPCTMAASVARSNGTELDECQVDGVIVTVRVSKLTAGFPVSATATAGPAVSWR